MVNQSTPWVAFSLAAVLIFCACGAVGERHVAESDGSDIGYNTRVGQGNTVDNAAEIYADGVTVEYHLAGTEPEFEGLDWKSLRLVLARDERQDEAWRLVAIIHDQWTP